MAFNLLSLGTALGGLSNGYQQAQQNALKQQLAQIQMASALQKLQQQQQMQQAGPVAWQALQQLGGGQGGQNPYAGLAGIGSGGTQAVTPQAPQFSDSSQDNTTPPPSADAGTTGNLVPGGGMSGGNWETRHNNFAGMRIPGTNAGPNAGGFQSFDTPEQGVAAISHQLDRYSSGATTGKPLTTIRQIVSTWAPPSENDTNALIKRASSVVGAGPDQPLDLSNPATKEKLVAAMIMNEQGGKLPVSPAVISKGVAMSPGSAGGTAQANPAVHIQQASGKTAADAASMLPQQMFGQFSLPTIAKAIEKANPDASPLVKFAALQELVKIMNPEDRMQTQMMLLQNRQEFQTALEMQRETFRDQEQNQRLESSQQNQGWTIGQVKDAQGNPVPVRINSRTGEVQPVQLPQGTTGLTHIGGGNSAGGLPPGWDNSKLDFWANVVKNGGQLPPGIARTAGGSAIVQAIMNRIPGASGDAGSFIANHATVRADTSSLNNLTKMTDAAESFEKTATKNFDLALSQAKDAVPTDSGPWLNKWVETGETQFGDENVPPYTAALLTAANEYAKIMSGSTGSQGSTVDSRREAAELFSPYLNAGQITRVVAIAKQDMANRKASLYGQVDEVKQRLKTAGSNKPTAEQGETEPQQPAVPASAPVKLDADGNPIQ